MMAGSLRRDQNLNSLLRERLLWRQSGSRCRWWRPLQSRADRGLVQLAPKTYRNPRSIAQGPVFVASDGAFATTLQPSEVPMFFSLVAATETC